MAANGISTLATKAARQVAKLNLAQTKRQTVGNGLRYNNVYDITTLSHAYGYLESATVNPLVAHRPWTGHV